MERDTIQIKPTTEDFGTKEWFFKKIDSLEELDKFKDEQANNLSKAFPDCLSVFDYRGLDLVEETVILAGIIASGKEESSEWISWFITELDYGKNVDAGTKTNCSILEKEYLVKDKESLWTVLQAL